MDDPMFFFWSSTTFQPEEVRTTLFLKSFETLYLKSVQEKKTFA
jgi:hypothetical protein